MRRRHRARVGLDGKLVGTTSIATFAPALANPPTTFADNQRLICCQKRRVALLGNRLQVAWIGAEKPVMNGRYQVLGVELRAPGPDPSLCMIFGSPAAVGATMRTPP